MSIFHLLAKLKSPTDEKLFIWSRCRELNPASRDYKSRALTNWATPEYKMAPWIGIEPMTFSLGEKRSFLLSYQGILEEVATPF